MEKSLCVTVAMGSQAGTQMTKCPNFHIWIFWVWVPFVEFLGLLLCFSGLLLAKMQDMDKAEVKSNLFLWEKIWRVVLHKQKWLYFLCLRSQQALVLMDNRVWDFLLVKKILYFSCNQREINIALSCLSFVCFPVCFSGSIAVALCCYRGGLHW